MNVCVEPLSDPRSSSVFAPHLSNSLILFLFIVNLLLLFTYALYSEDLFPLCCFSWGFSFSPELLVAVKGTTCELYLINMQCDRFYTFLIVSRFLLLKCLTLNYIVHL